MSETSELPEVDSEQVVEQTPVEKPGSNKPKIIAACAAGVAVLAIGSAVAVGVYGQSQVDNARRSERSAVAKEKAAEAKPPKVVTKTVTKEKIVPTFGRSTLMGVYAAGAIQSGGVYVGQNQDFTPNDGTCSSEYSNLSQLYTAIVIDRSPFMQACLASLPQTLKKDTSPS